MAGYGGLGLHPVDSKEPLMLGENRPQLGPSSKRLQTMGKEQLALYPKLQGPRIL